ncbi:polysaccharide pyruvyl transferase family protein [Caproiciproducens sp. R2]|uniref:polysaccharide pyruvyl transferase family protein n=1 Tax=Caproiciproducens sp. R2 TaxID=3435187 RepID=UPI0040337278
MYNFLLYHHGGSCNHGCEALVRSSTKILSRNGRVSIRVASNNQFQDEMYICSDNIEFFDNYKLFGIPKKHLKFINLASGRLFHRIPFESCQLKMTINIAKQSNAVISIGGDNYSYGKSMFISLVDQRLRKYCKISVLWGCSIDEGLLDPIKNKFKINNLKSFSLITARESITYNALLKAGVDKNTKLYPDPAFQLDKVELPLPDGFVEGNTVGINVSPLIIGCEKDNGITMNNYEALLQHIIDHTDMRIALIPHVVWSDNDDRKPLGELYKRFAYTNRIVMIEDHNCMELKGYIARCRMFIGARTHATIAAYSTCVPTLAVGYSVKAKGIAKDIFGTYENYVIPVQSLKNKNDLIIAFEWLKKHEDSIRKHLQEFMPAYCKKALEAGKEIEKLMGENY